MVCSCFSAILLDDDAIQTITANDLGKEARHHHELLGADVLFRQLSGLVLSWAPRIACLIRCGTCVDDKPCPHLSAPCHIVLGTLLSPPISDGDKQV